MGNHLPARFDADDLRSAVAQWQQECGVRVANRRTIFGIHRRDLAALAGTTEATIQRIETGKLNPRDPLRFALAGVLRCEVADLWPYPPCTRIHDMAQAVA